MIRIAVTGPESCGKTTLAKSLSQHFQTQYVPEFAREYLLNLNRPYVQSDLDHIAKGHLNSILENKSDLPIVDTDFVVLKIWSEYKYGECSPIIQKEVEANYFDLHLLCSPDIPWEEDILRENPNDREKLFDMYCNELTKLRKSFTIIRGEEEDRIKKAIAAINSVIQSK